MSFSISKILLIPIILAWITGHAFAGDLVVGKEEHFKSISEAVQNAYTGDRIIIKGGYYNEGNIIINKTLEITGQNNPVLDGNNNSEILTISADNVQVRGVVFKNTGISFIKDIAGIRVENADNVLIENNIFENNFFAIYFANSEGSIVRNNYIKGNAQTESFSGNGIHLWKCRRINIEGNEIFKQRDGIYFEFVTNSKITGNFSHNNLRYGLHFMFSEGNSYIKNTFKENGAGVAVMYTKHVEMIDNIFENNWGPNSYGLLLKDIDKSVIKNNTFNKNTVGIYMESSNGLVIENNNLTSNGWAMKVLADCNGDSILFNNFTNNTFDVSTNSSRNANFFDNNYWDKYNGYDLDKNGIGDIPYRPVSMFSIVVERTPESILLLHSFIVDLLDMTEKVIPVFIPETLADNNPEMRFISMNKGTKQLSQK